jgi:hypothetical protein
VSMPVLAVHIISDPLAAGVTHCGRYEGGVFKADVPVVVDPAQGGGNICYFNIDTQTAGTTVIYTATSVSVDPLWGRGESAQSLPLSVVRPGVPATAPKNERAVAGP